MARGLSDLQTKILVNAYNNHAREHRQTPKYVLAISLEPSCDGSFFMPKSIQWRNVDDKPKKILTGEKFCKIKG